MTRTARARRTPDRGTARQSEASSAAATSSDQSDERRQPAEDGRANRFWRSFLHDRSVRSRIAALTIIPLVAMLVFGTLFVANNVQRARAADDVQQLAEVGLAAMTLAHRVQDERDTTALADSGITGTEALTEARADTDRAIAELDEVLDEVRDSHLYDAAAGLIINYDREIGRLPTYRETADQFEQAQFDRAAAIIYQRLGEAVLGIVTIADVAADDPETAQQVAALGSISAATLSASYERGLFTFTMEQGQPPTFEQQRDSAVFRDQQELFIDTFLESFTFEDRRPYANDIIRGSRSTATVRAAIAAGLPARATKEGWYQASTVRIDAFREIEGSLGAQIATRAADNSTQAWLRAGISAAAVLVVLGLTIALATYVARSIVGPLSRLREAALNTASRGLPGLVDRIRQDGPAVARNTQLAVTPEGRDEIGQVANAFNDVQKTAVQVASDQALLRQNLDTIVVNLSRRTQSLIDRQLGEIEGLEARERDPEQLSTLFRIDHMATRVRRHAESLLVLAGVEEMRKHGAATPVLDVVRTAVGEVEQYPRVKFGVMPTDLIASVGVDDIAHLLAELIDNATEFSSPSTPVTITSQPLLGGGLRIQVTDVGLGVPSDQLAALNERLSNPGDIDVAASRTLGLYVVARLANKHGIRVRLEPGQPNGLIAQVDLPAHLILSPLDTTEGVIPPVKDADDAPHATAATPSLLGSTEGPAEDDLPRRAPQDLPRRQNAEPVQAQAYAQPQDAPQAPAPQSIWGPPVAPNPTPWTPPVDTPAPASSDTPPRPQAAPSVAAPASQPITPLIAPGGDRRHVTAPDPSSRQPRPAADPAAGPANSPEHPGSGGLYDGPGTQDLPVVGYEAGRNDGAPAHDHRTHYQPPAPTRPPAHQLASRPAHVPPRPVTADAVVDQSLRKPEPSLPEGDAPIYDAVRSAWFSDGGPNRDFSSPADAGWKRAAEALRSAEEAASARRTQHREAQGDRAPYRPEPSRRTPAASSSPFATESLLRGEQSDQARNGRSAPSYPQRPAERPAERPAAASSPPAQPARRPEAPAAAWTSGGDPGPAADEPMLSPTGLPVRRRGASLVPGSIIESPPEAPAPAAAARKDAGSVASTLSSLQRGVSRGRDDSGGWVPNRPSDAERSNP